jgi:hypothetical protein
MTGANAQKGSVEITTSSATLVNTIDYTTGTEGLTTNVTLRITGEATDNNDIVHEITKGNWAPTAP